MDYEEDEACGEDTNLGCSGVGVGQPPNPFWLLLPPGEAISLDPANPNVIHGEAWAENNVRDVDWYVFSADSTPDVIGNQDGMIFVCLSALSELPIGAVVGTLLAVNSCDGLLTGVFSSVGFECESTFNTTIHIPTSSGSNDLGVIIVRTYDGVEVFNGYPCAPACSWDCEPAPNGNVGINAFLELLANWGDCDTETTFGHDYLLNVALVDDPSLCFPDPQ